MTTNYILKVGEAGERRLKLIHSVYGAGTEKLLSAVGIEPGMTIADIGCGIGTVSFWLAYQVGPTGVVWCVDNSPEQLGVAESSAGKLGLTNVRFIESSAESINLPDESLDVAYCRFLLDHLAAPSEAVEEVQRILKPGGAFVTETIDFTGMASDPIQPVYARELQYMSELSERRNVDAGSGLKVHRLFRSAGFTRINVSLNQPAYLTGEEKRFWEYSVAEKADTLIAHGLATAAEMEQRVSEMRRVNLDDSILLALPRSVQVWAYK
jgi:SAM-dependent methyltransferase